MYNTAPNASNESQKPILQSENIEKYDHTQKGDKKQEIIVNAYNDEGIQQTNARKNNLKSEEIVGNDTRNESRGTLNIFSRQDESAGPATMDVNEKETVFTPVKPEADEKENANL